MTVYSYAQLEQLWINAGGSAAMAPLMAAIAEAESSGNPDAVNPSGATGLWQILGAVNPADQPNLTDPVTNAKEAVLKYQSQGLDAWTTYASGAYEPFLSNSTPPDPNGIPASATLTAATTTTADGSCLVGPFPHTSWCILDKSEARAFIGGALMVAGALILLPGLIILVASGFRGAGGPAAVAGTAQALGRVPVYGRAVRGLA